jgi:iron complex outermembrane recepter protein
MIGIPHGVPSKVTACVLLATLWLSLASASAQTPSGGSSGTQSSAQAENGIKAADDILNLDIEQLAKTPVVVPSMDMPVSSVTKEMSTVGRSAAAVFVITNEMIRRSGVTNIPDALRMAPGVQVMQINSNTWSITIRGFSFGPFTNKLLVLIDGRTVYNPDFAGVFWNAEDVLLEDVDRIEVIRGPGGTLWGANAVNGVINIITKEAKNTQGTYVMAGGGSYIRDTEAFRYGGKIGDDCQYRIYGKHFEDGPYFNAGGNYMDDTNDSWRQGRFGFRADWQPDRDKSNLITIQGDHFVGTTDNSIVPTYTDLTDSMTGDNILMRWRHIYDDDRDFTLQTYYDSYLRQDSLQTQYDKTFDIDAQYRFPVGDRHSITCGAEYRNVESYFSGGDTFTNWFGTEYCTTNYPSQFIQDEISLVDDRLVFTIGTKVEENPYTGLEYQPSARLLWAPDKRHSTWCAVSRAVHSPTRMEEYVEVTGTHFYPPAYQRGMGSTLNTYDLTSLVSESVISYEVGYREQMTDKFSWDVATFYNRYNDVILSDKYYGYLVQNNALIIPLYYNNSVRGDTYGIELSSKLELSDTWRLQGAYTMFEMNMFNDVSTYCNGWNPNNELYLRSSWDLNKNTDLDITFRYVDQISSFPVSSYLTMDARIAWRPRKHLELALVGQNLLQDHHQEYAGIGMVYQTEVVRSVYATATWRF